MGRWTPLILMAGGLAILLGTLLGISFPMGVQNNAQAPGGGKTSKVLPANINVNSTATDTNSANSNANSNRNNVAQTSTPDDTVTDTTTDTTTTAQDNSETIDETQPNTNDANQSDDEPIRALW